MAASNGKSNSEASPKSSALGRAWTTLKRAIFKMMGFLKGPSQNGSSAASLRRTFRKPNLGQQGHPPPSDAHSEQRQSNQLNHSVTPQPSEAPQWSLQMTQQLNPYDSPPPKKNTPVKLELQLENKSLYQHDRRKPISVECNSDSLSQAQLISFAQKAMQEYSKNSSMQKYLKNLSMQDQQDISSQPNSMTMQVQRPPDLPISLQFTSNSLSEKDLRSFAELATASFTTREFINTQQHQLGQLSSERLHASLERTAQTLESEHQSRPEDSLAPNTPPLSKQSGFPTPHQHNSEPKREYQDDHPVSRRDDEIPSAQLKPLATILYSPLSLGPQTTEKTQSLTKSLSLPNTQLQTKPSKSAKVKSHKRSLSQSQ